MAVPIEGLEDGKCAYMQIFHHCMMDGEGAFKMMEIIGDFEPGPVTDKKVDKSVSEARAGKVPTYPERSTKALRHLARLPGDAARSAYDILRPKVLEQFVWPRKPRSERPIVPTVCFNGVISSAVRSYLDEYAELPGESLRTNIPVSLRLADDAQLGNKVTTTTITLATHLKDPVARLQAINQESEQAKARTKARTKTGPASKSSPDKK